MLSSTSSMVSSKRTLSVLGMALVVCIVGATAVNSFAVGNRPVSKRSFFDIQCKGVYDKGIFAKLDRVCDDCYNLYREPQLHALCSQKCFSTPYFFGCLDALTMKDREKEFQELIDIINAPNPFDDLDIPLENTHLLDNSQNFDNNNQNFENNNNNQKLEHIHHDHNA